MFKEDGTGFDPRKHPYFKKLRGDVGEMSWGWVVYVVLGAAVVAGAYYYFF